MRNTWHAKARQDRRQRDDHELRRRKLHAVEAREKDRGYKPGRRCCDLKGRYRKRKYHPCDVRWKLQSPVAALEKRRQRCERRTGCERYSLWSEYSLSESDHRDSSYPGCHRIERQDLYH